IVKCTGDERLLYRANLECRVAIRVLRPLATFRAENEKSLYEGVQRIDWSVYRSEEHTSELQSLAYLVCRLLLEKKKARGRATAPQRKGRRRLRRTTIRDGSARFEASAGAGRGYGHTFEDGRHDVCPVHAAHPRF